MGSIVINTPAAFNDSMDEELKALYSTYSLKLAEIRMLRSNTGRGRRLLSFKYRSGVKNSFQKKTA